MSFTQPHKALRDCLECKAGSIHSHQIERFAQPIHLVSEANHLAEETKRG